MTDHTPREDENTGGENQPVQEDRERTSQPRTGAEDEQRYTTFGVLNRITRWLRGR